MAWGINIEDFESQFEKFKDREGLTLILEEQESLPKPLLKMKNLRRLWVYGKSQEPWPDFLKDMNLNQLRVAIGQGTKLPAILGELATLERLEICNNPQWGPLEMKRGQFPRVTTLSLSGYSLELFNSSIRLPQLRSLVLSSAGADLLISDELAECQALERLNVDAGAASSIPEVFTKLSNLRELEFDGWASTLQFPKSFANLKKLKTLTLRCKIDTLPEPLRSLKKLKTLNIHKGNEPLILPEWFGELSSLETLKVIPEVEAVPETMGQLKNLTQLYLSCEKTEDQHFPKALLKLNKLQKIDLDLGACDCSEVAFDSWQNLESLHLRGNNGEEFPVALCGLKKLKELDLWLECSSIPDDIGQLENLESFKLYSLKLMDRFPLGLTKLKKLRSVELDFCKLQDAMPEGMAELTGLENFSSGDWIFERFPDQVLNNWKKVKKIKASGAGIESLSDAIGELSSLESLSLSHNKLETLPAAVQSLKKLKELDLSSCPIKSLPDELTSLTSLEILDLGYSEIRELPANLGQLKSLKRIDVAMCKSIKRLPETLHQCLELDSINAYDSSLSSLPERLGEAPRLANLWLQRSSVKSLPESIYQSLSIESLELDGNLFPESEFSKLARVEARIGYKLKMPRRQKVIRIPKKSSKKALSKEVLEQLKRLGAVFDKKKELKGPQSATFPFGEWPLPLAMRQFCHNVQWPEKIRFTGKIGSSDFWMVELTGGYVPDEHNDWVHYHPFYAIGMMDGGNYSFLVKLNDRCKSDPAVWSIDHDDFAEKDGRKVADKLSTFLTSLNAEA
jgi:Leucine-rich repeat (LRR) protein